jgi:hypothetical protein
MGLTATVRKYSLSAAIAGLTVASLCAVLALTSLVAALIAAPAGNSIEALRSGESLETGALKRTATLSLRAGDVFDRGRYYSDAALAAGRLGAKDRAQILGDRTLSVIVDQALIADPASPYNWARRAAEQLAAKDYRGARASLETSILLGRFMPGLTVPRLRILLKLLQRSPDRAMERYFEEQVRIAALTEPHDLAAFADKGAAEGWTQRVLAVDLPLYNAYLTHLIALRDTQASASRKDNK